MNSDAKTLVETAEAQLEDIERELSRKPSPPLFDLLKSQFNGVTKLVEDAEKSDPPPSVGERLAKVKSRLETAGVTFANCVNEPEPFDPWDTRDD